jgi:hypothetical protein
MSVRRSAARSCSIRIVNIYATGYRYYGEGSGQLPEKLRLGRLKEFYEVYREQLPRWLPAERVPVHNVTFPAPIDGIAVREVDTLLFALPSNQVVMAVILDLTTLPLTNRENARPTSAVLAECIEVNLRLERRDLSEHLQLLAARIDGLELDQNDVALLPERHQLVFVPRLGSDEDVPDDEVVDEIVYREEPPYREEFTGMQKPEQLNQKRPGNAGTVPRQATLGVVTPYVSLIYGHEGFVEDSILLSTVQAVGTASRFRQIWHEAYRQVRVFRNEKQRQEAGEQSRADLEELADNLGNLEFDLTFSVEFPLMRIESFHSALYAAMDLPAQAQTLSQMFTQLGGSLKSEITAIDIRERRKDEGRQKWNSVAASILSLIGVSVGFVVAFLGINATQVDNSSMWSSRYAPLYFTAGLFALTPVALILFPYLRDWSARRTDRRDLRYGSGLTVFGLLLGALAYLDDRVSASRFVVDALGKSVAIFLVVVGLVPAVLRLARWIAGWRAQGSAAAWRRGPGPAPLRR